MKVIIDIPESIIEHIKDGSFGARPYDRYTLVVAVLNGTSLPTGRWIRWHEKVEKDGCVETILHCKCSNCNTEYEPHTSQFINYCPICGAKMEVEE